MSEEKNKVTQAFERLREQYDSLAIVCGILDVSNTYVYRSMKVGQVSLPCALKMEILLGEESDIRWQDLAPKAAEDVESVRKRMN